MPKLNRRKHNLQKISLDLSLKAEHLNRPAKAEMDGAPQSPRPTKTRVPRDGHSGHRSSHTSRSQHSGSQGTWHPRYSSTHPPVRVPQAMLAENILATEVLRKCYIILLTQTDSLVSLRRIRLSATNSVVTSSANAASTITLPGCF